jgi:hypothetical protein
MRSHEERKEERRVGERRCGDDVLLGDVDGCEPRCGQKADENEVGKLAVAIRQGAPSAS